MDDSEPTDEQLTAAAPETVPALISYKGRSIRARIDTDVPITEIVKQLVLSAQLHLQDKNANLFVLRDSASYELVTAGNLQEKLRRGASFQLTLAPLIEAAEMVERLSSQDDPSTKLATFELKRLICDPIFRDEFIARGGLVEITSLIERASGNTLAYSLEAMAVLMESSSSWDGLDVVFITRIVNIFATLPLININRPAILILAQLALYDPNLAPVSEGKKAAQHSTYAYGLGVLWPIIQRTAGFFTVLRDRLSSGDQSLIQAALRLTNALVRCAVVTRHYEVLEAIEGSEVIKAVIHLAEGDLSDRLKPLVIQYQDNLASMIALYIRTPVSFENPQHVERLNSVLSAASLLPNDTIWQEGTLSPLGLSTQHPEQEFAGCGLFGLCTMQSFARSNKSSLAKMLSDSSSRPSDRRCPFARTSNRTALLLAQVYNFDSTTESPNELLPFALSYHQLHSLSVKLFYRLWAESNAVLADFDRIAGLVANQIQYSLTDNDGNKTFYDLEREFQNIEYRQIRERQMQELALEDDLLSKGPVRTLRARLYKESFEFIRQQRKNCLTNGAWFLASAKPDPRRPAMASHKVWRFYRLAGNPRYLHYMDAPEPRSVRSGLEDLTSRIDLSSVTEILPNAPETANKLPAAAGHRRTQSTQQQQQQSATSFTFSLQSAEGQLADFTTSDVNVYAEWIDGISLLRPSGYVFTKQTADLVQTLTDIGIKVKLLDLSGERIDIPQELPALGPPPPASFHYADVVG